MDTVLKRDTSQVVSTRHGTESNVPVITNIKSNISPKIKKCVGLPQGSNLGTVLFVNDLPEFMNKEAMDVSHLVLGMSREVFKGTRKGNNN